MSRTLRKPRPRFHRRSTGFVRDGAPQYHTKGCQNGGSCSWCEGNRTHASRRRMPDADSIRHGNVAGVIVQNDA